MSYIGASDRSQILGVHESLDYRYIRPSEWPSGSLRYGSVEPRITDKKAARALLRRASLSFIFDTEYTFTQQSTLIPLRLTTVTPSYYLLYYTVIPPAALYRPLSVTTLKLLPYRADLSILDQVTPIANIRIAADLAKLRANS